MRRVFAQWALHPLTGPPAVGFGFLVALAATLVRVALDPLLDGQSIFLLYFPALLLSATWAGLTGGVVTASIGGLLAIFLFSRLGMSGPGLLSNLISLAFFWLVSALLVWGAINLKTALRQVLDHERELVLQHERQSILAGEMRHRVKNLLAVVQAMVWESSRGASDARELSRALQSRLAALSASQDVALNPSGRATLDRAVTLGLEAFASPRICRRLVDAELEALTARAVVLALYELATNASKYGALSTPEGHVSLAAEVEGEHVRLEWKEQGGPTVCAPARPGFGTRLIRSVPAHGDEHVRLEYEPDGVRCIFVLRALPSE